MHHQEIRIGDLVSLKPRDSNSIVSTVIMVVPLNGTTTYTSEHVHAPQRQGSPARVTRYRFRLQDVHRVIPH
ncbi:hypothetical protein GCM10025795_02090 [Verticiella sediminum]